MSAPEHVGDQPADDGRDAPEASPPAAPDEPEQAGGKDDGKDGDAPREETVAPDAEWDSGNTQRDRQRDEGLRALGEDPHDPRRRGAFFATAGTYSGGKLAVGSGAISAEQVHNYHLSAATTSVHGGILPADVVTASVDTHVPTADQAPLREVLFQHKVAYLSGPAGTGRLATAYAVLAELCGVDKIVMVDVDEDTSLTVALHQDGVLRPGHGHVLELTAGQPAPRGHTLGGAAEACGDGGYVIVIGPPAPAGNSLRQYEIAHRPPAAADVLDSHLTHLLRTREGRPDADVLAWRCRSDEAIARYLAASWQPAEVVVLARRLVEVAKRDGTPAEALDLLPGALRALAVDVLKDADGDTNTLRRLTARIAYAIYHGTPLTVVFELASTLRAALPPEDPDEPEPVARTVFDGGIDGLVPWEMRARDEDGTGAADAERLARLRDPELARAVLDVVWHDYDHLRTPLLAWLFVLGGDHRERIRIRAGQVAGQLAIYDFGRIYRELFRLWATSPRTACRQAVAWAMERAALEPRLTARVSRQVADWVFSPDPLLNDSAARCLATRIGTESPEDALDLLYLVAVREDHAHRPAVAQAVAQLYRPDEPDTGRIVLAELSRWAGDDERCLQAQAARALTFLTHREASPPDEHWPALLLLAAGDPEAWSRLVGLWQTALTEPTTGIRSWEVLRVWLLRADEHPDVHDAVLRLATEVLRTPPVRSRALFTLTQWRSRHAGTSIVRRIHDTLRKDDR